MKLKATVINPTDWAPVLNAGFTLTGDLTGFEANAASLSSIVASLSSIVCVVQPCQCYLFEAGSSKTSCIAVMANSLVNATGRIFLFAHDFLTNDYLKKMNNASYDFTDNINVRNNWY